MSTALERILVVEWAVWAAGPICSLMLGDLGADVIKIEHRVTGDPARGLEAGFDMKLGTPRQAFFETINRNKRGVVLDLGKQKGREIVYQMVEKADVFVTNFRQSAIRRYGMDYETLSKYNPKLVYGLVTGYGSKGPDVDLRSYDGLGQARSGFMTRCTADEPIYVGGGIGDAVTATMLAFGVVSALFTRERQGTGQKVETALLSTLMFEQIGDLGMHFIGGLPTVPIPRQKAMNPLVNTYRCADNRWIYLSHLEADRFWPNLCRALGIEELHNDPRFENISKRSGNEELIAILDRIFATKTRDEWLTILRENDCVFARVNTYDDLPADPQIIANDYLPEYDHPGYGRTRYPPIPVELSRTPGAIRRPAPQWGQHTEEVLTELLGYTWDQIARLKEDEVI